MSSRSGLNYTNVSADAMITNEPTLLYGAVILCRDLGGDATIYDGRDATSGRKVMVLNGREDISVPIMFPKPILLPLGLFVGVGEDVTDLVLLWERGPVSARFEAGVRES